MSINADNGFIICLHLQNVFIPCTSRYNSSFPAGIMTRELITIPQLQIKKLIMNPKIKAILKIFPGPFWFDHFF